MTIFARGMLLAAFTAFSAGSASAADLTIGLGVPFRRSIRTITTSPPTTW